MYTLTDVTKNYQKGRRTITALRGLNLVIGDGEWLAVQGRTGHGKTTLLHILGGLDRPSTGTVTFAGHDLSRLREAQVTRLRAESIGFIFQTFNLVPTLSAAENVESALIPLRTRPPDGTARSPPPWTRSDLATGHGTCPASSPAGSSNGSPSPAPWSNSPGCCWPTSPPATSMKTPATRSPRCWRCCGATSA